jgi:hypothetical protein
MHCHPKKEWPLQLKKHKTKTSNISPRGWNEVITLKLMVDFFFFRNDLLYCVVCFGLLVARWRSSANLLRHTLSKYSYFLLIIDNDPPSLGMCSFISTSFQVKH